MPRINRVRLHNIHYGKEDRLLDNLILDLQGKSGLVILENGGGKTLLLHLIAQCICPNVPLQSRYISKLLEKKQFTGHVLVEWLLDGGRPSYILTGFCFAENLGSANRNMDYFNYIGADVYVSPNPWDLERFPLLDEDGRTLNYRELRERLASSGGRIRTFASDRRQEYQRKLLEYNINAREWEQVITTNSTEGGVKEYFESCVKTRSLLEKLILPAIDSVLGRGANAEQDSLTLTFRQYSEELMHLPVLQANLQGLGKMALHIPRLKESLARVREARSGVKTAVGNRQALYNTLCAGVPRLDERLHQLREEKSECGRKKGMLEFLLASVDCEGLRRQWQSLQAELDVKEGRLEVARKAAGEAGNDLHRRQAWLYYGRWQIKKANLQREEEHKQLLIQGKEAAEQEIDHLRAVTWPLQQAQESCLIAASQSGTEDLERLRQEQQQIIKEEENTKREKHDCEIKQARLDEQSKGFLEKQKSLADDILELGITLGEPDETLGQLHQKQRETERDRDRWAGAVRELQARQEQCVQRFYQLKKEEITAARQCADIEADREKWQQAFNQLNEALALAGIAWPLPLPDPLPLQLELERLRVATEHDVVSLEIDRNRVEERKALLRGEGIPNADIILLQNALKKLDIDTITGSAFLREQADDETRQQYAERHPWLPYALVAEEGQVARLLRQPEKLKIDLASAVPVAVRSRLQESSDHTVGSIYFFNNRGIDPFVYPSRLDEILIQLEDQQEQIAHRKEEIERKRNRISVVSSKLDILLNNFGCLSEDYWAASLKEAKYALDQVQQSIEVINKELKQLSVDLDAATNLERSAAQGLRELEAVNRRLLIYDGDWHQESGRQQEIGNLSRKLKTLEELLAEHARHEAELGQAISEADERLKVINYKLDELKKYEDTLFPSAWSQEQAEDTGETGGWDDYIAAAGVLKAKIDAMSRDVAGLDELNRRIEEYQRDLRNLEADIQGTGQEFEEVAASYRPVTEQELSKCRKEVDGQNKILRQAENEYQKTGGKVQTKEDQWQEKYNQIMTDHGRLPAEFAEADLDQRREELTEESKQVLAAIENLADQISSTDRLLGTYQDVIAELQGEGLEEDTVPAWDPDVESEVLRNNPDASRHAARKAARDLKQAQESLSSTLEEWLRTVNATQGDLDTLNNLDVNNIFRQLRARTAMPNWEEESELVADSLTHVERVVENARTELERRMADMDRIMEEIVARSYRQATNALDELQLFQGMSTVELRGTRQPLIRIDLRRPEAAEGKERMWRYLQRVIEDAVQRRQSGEGDDVLQQFLASSVRSPALIEQLTPLDEIRFDVLKPRSGGSVYQSSDYDRWHDLVEWSVGQRYIGRFTVFVVLMAYLRQRRSTGQKTSVVIADNPFGEASSGHILEILSAAVKQTGIQLICVTAHRQSDIMREFSVLYSLVSRGTMSGQLRMIAKDESPRSMEAAYGVMNREERPEWKMDIGGQLRMF